MWRIMGWVALAILLVIYLTTLQTIPNGSEHYYMIDVGETQTVLNQWGTLHATGYPLYVIVSNIGVALLRASGMDAATAPAVTSLVYALAALGVLYVLAVAVLESPAAPDEPTSEGRKTSALDKGLLAAGMVLLYGLTRTVWVHAAIAEVYAFGLLILAALLVIALWPRPIRGRVYWLALLGGMGAFHHRAIAMAAPALIYAVWPEIVALPASRHGRAVDVYAYAHVLRRIGLCLLLGLTGFAQYLYLPLRALAAGKWVYGDPGTWDGFWDQFLGREASRFIGTVTGGAGLAANLNLVNTVLVTDLTLPGVLLGLAGLLLALWNPARRKLAITLLLSGGAAYAFHVLAYTDVLSALILPVTLALAFGWLLLAERITGGLLNLAVKTATSSSSRAISQRLTDGLILGMTVGCAGYLVAYNQPFIHEMTTNRTGLETIELAKGVPEGAVLMLDWGPRYFAAGFAQDVLGELPGVTLVNHKANFKTLVVNEGRQLVTADFTFYNRPVSWWEQQLGQPVYLRAAAPHLVEIGASPVLNTTARADGITALNAAVVCTANDLQLQVDWVTAEQPDHDLSVFVHLLDSAGTMIAQADEAAPVYGWRPLTTWQAGEVVHDIYVLPRLPEASSIAYGLYRQLASGEFVNDYSFSAAVKCG